MNSYSQTIPQLRASVSLRAVIALFAVVAFLLVVGAALALGVFQGDGTATPSQEHPVSGISNGSPGKP